MSKHKAKMEICYAGRTKEIINKFPTGNHRVKRNEKRRITPESVQRNNDRLALIDFRRKINHNFNPGDMHVTLTYKGRTPSRENAHKTIKGFVRNLRRKLAAADQELRYVEVTEYENTRIHHHIIISRCEEELISELWTQGFVNIKYLDNSGNYSKLAEYLFKETSKTFRNPRNCRKRRYSCSKNLEKPKAEVYDVNVKVLHEDPVAEEGYYIDADSIKKYNHPVTELPHMEYIQVLQPGKEHPKKKNRKRGGKPAKKEYFKPNYFEEQLSLLEEENYYEQETLL